MMKFVFDRFAEEDGGSALVDWLVLTTGIVLLAVSLAITFTGTTEAFAGGTADPISNTTDFHSS